MTSVSRSRLNFAHVFGFGHLLHNGFQGFPQPGVEGGVLASNEVKVEHGLPDLVNVDKKTMDTHHF